MTKLYRKGTSRTTALAATERDGNNSKGFQDFRLKNGSSLGQNLALTVSCVPNALDSGLMLNPEPSQRNIVSSRIPQHTL